MLSLALRHTDQFRMNNIITEIRIGPQGMAWKPLDAEAAAQPVTIAAADVKWAEWLRVARNFQLRVGLKEKGKRVTFDGFLKEVCLHDD